MKFFIRIEIHKITNNIIGDFVFNKKKKMNEKLDSLNETLEKSNLRELAHMLGSKKEIFWRNFLVGIARGIGTAIGFTILGAIVIYSLQYIVKLNLPVIGEYISDIVEIVQENDKKR